MGIRRGLTYVVASGLVAVCLGSGGQEGTGIRAVPDRTDGIYRIGDRVGWTLSSPGGTVTYVVRRNNLVPILSGSLDLGAGPARVEVAATEPAMLYLEVTPVGGPAKAFGAAVEPTRLRPVEPRPKDFDAFWRGKLAEMRRIPENPVLKPGDSGKPGLSYATIQMDHVNGTHVYGQIARPEKPGKYPAMLILQWASPPYRLWSPWVTERAAEGYLALNIQPHDVLPTEPEAYYQALPQEIKNYASIGQGDRERSYFVEMYLRGVRAVDYLTKRPDWDGKTIVVMGTSMGGQQSLAVAGLHPKVTHLIVNEPAGCDLNGMRYGRQAGYPFFGNSDPQVLATARYVDAIHFAPRIQARSLVSMGFIDTATPPAGIWTALNLIRGPKEAAPMPESPHNNFATPEQQRPYTERATAWLAAIVKGKPVPAR